MKYCLDCDQWKPTEDFGKNRQTRDGLQVYCRTCCNVRLRIANPQSRQRNRAKRRAAYDAALQANAAHRCTKCGQTKFAPEFGFLVNNADGIDSWCRACKNRARADYRTKKRQQIEVPA